MIDCNQYSVPKNFLNKISSIEFFFLEFEIFRMKLLASIYLLCGFAVGKAPHKKEDLEQMNEEQRHDFDKNIMLDTTDDVSALAL